MAALALLTGCGGQGAGGPETLTVYVSAPLHGERALDGRAVANGLKLALAERGGRVGELRIRTVYLDDTGGGRRWTPAGSAADARRAAEDSSAIGYIGELDSGATRFSLPITNQAEIAQISPGSTAVDLTRQELGEVDPDEYRPSGKQTFARVVPDDAVQARAAALLAKRLGARQVAVVSDRTKFGAVTSAAFADQAELLGLQVASTGRPKAVVAKRAAGADAIYYGGLPGRGAEGLAALAAGAPAAPIIGSDAMLEESLRDCEAFAAPFYVTSSFQDRSQLPARAGGFERAYRERFGPPPPAAAYGYEAMALLLDAIRRAGGGGDDRGDVVDALLSTSGRRSVLGDYSIEGDGDTTLDRISAYVTRGCRQSFDRGLRAPR